MPARSVFDSRGIVEIRAPTPAEGGKTMLSAANFVTITGATAITVAVVRLLRALWPRGPEPWITWGVAEGVTLIGGLLTRPLTAQAIVLLGISGMVVAATALGSQAGWQQVAPPPSNRQARNPGRDQR
jgi:hypothetical protein